MNEDRRDESRRLVCLAADVEQPGDPTQMALIRDVSPSGAYLLTRLEVAAGRGKGLESCWQRGRLLQERLTAFREDATSGSIQWFETKRHSFRLNPEVGPLATLISGQQTGVRQNREVVAHRGL